MNVNLAVRGKSVESEGDDLIIRTPEGAYKVSRYSCEIIDAFEGYREFLKKDLRCRPLGDDFFESSPRTTIIIYGSISFEFPTELLEPCRGVI